MANKVSKYFLGETTPMGFKTSFDEQIRSKNFYTYILKGGPGTGKSSLMKKIALEFSDIDDLDLYHCSSDPNSLDAVVLKGAEVAVVDGTSPHVFDANYPGVCQSIVNLGACWDKEKLQKYEEMMEKVKILKEEIKNRQLNVLIEVDGGINQDTVKIALDAGADICVAGTSVFKAQSAKGAIDKLKGETN